MLIPSITRTLVLTHLRQAEARNLALCTKMWNLGTPSFPHAQPFLHRLSLTEEGVRLPEGPLTSRDDQVFSWSGAIDDATPPFSHRYAGVDFFPAAEYGFADRGRQRFVLGGGNLDFCLARTFESLLKIKAEQGEKLEVIIPLAMTYFSKQVTSPIDYILQPNNYEQALQRAFADRIIPGFEIYIDEAQHTQRFPINPQVELHWYTSLKAMFNSPRFFPETSGDVATLGRLIHYFAPKKS